MILPLKDIEIGTIHLFWGFSKMMKPFALCRQKNSCKLTQTKIFLPFLFSAILLPLYTNLMWITGRHLEQPTVNSTSTKWVNELKLKDLNPQTHWSPWGATCESKENFSVCEQWYEWCALKISIPLTHISKGINTFLVKNSHLQSVYKHFRKSLATRDT